MGIAQNVRDFAARQGFSEQDAPTNGMEVKSVEFVKRGTGCITKCDRRSVPHVTQPNLEKIMGLLDSVIGSVMNNMGDKAGSQAGGGDIMQMIMGLLQQNGGLSGLVQTLGKSGLADQVASWVGTGANQPVSPDQIGQKDRNFNATF